MTAKHQATTLMGSSGGQESYSLENTTTQLTCFIDLQGLPQLSKFEIPTVVLLKASEKGNSVN